MAPPAVTAAGRTATARSRPAEVRTPGHRRTVRQPPAPRAPRRVSGPARARSRPAAAPRTSITFGAHALAVVRSLPEHSLIDRLVRGRAWIPVLGVLLAGIVAMQVEVLKLGTSMGRAIQRGSTLQSQNEMLRASVASLADDQRIERLAAGMGMVMPAPTGVAFLSAQPGGNAGQAITNIHTPDPTGFASTLSAQLAAAAAAAGAGSPAAAATVATTTSGATAATTSAAGSPSGTAAASSTGSSSTGSSATGSTATGSSSTGSSGSGATGTGSSGAAATPSSTPSGSPAAAQGPATGAAAIAPAGSNQSSGATGG
jgi:hypothetical protein